MQEWSVAIETGARPADVEEKIDDILDALQPYAGAFSIHPLNVSARLNVEATTAKEAIDQALDVFEKVLPGEEIVRCEAQTVEELDKQLEESNAPEFMGVTEIARVIGVSRARASQIVRQPVFPSPAAQLAGGPVYSRRSVALYLKQWDRKPGRRIAGTAKQIVRKKELVRKRA